MMKIKYRATIEVPDHYSPEVLFEVQESIANAIDAINAIQVLRDSVEMPQPEASDE